MIPRTFDQWRDCIVNDCKIDLTKAFAEERIAVYSDSRHPETQKFAKLYGMKHLKNVIYWYSKVAEAVDR